MFSLALLLEGYAEGPKDQSGLSAGVALSNRLYDERAYALSLLDGVASITDVDVKLQEDPKLYAAMEQETTTLLLSARYKPEKIREGLKKFARRR